MPVTICHCATNFALADALERTLGRTVDVVRIDRADTVLAHEIARGQLLFESVRGEFAHFAADAVLDFLEMEPMLRDAQRRYLAALALGSRG
jgi:hypothetical protein